MLTYRVKIIVGERPPDLPDGVAFVAPRPLHGTPVVIDGLTNWVGLVVVEPDQYRRDDALESNARLDATLIVWVGEDVALSSARSGIELEYGADAIDGLADDALLDWFTNRCAPRWATIDEGAWTFSREKP